MLLRIISAAVLVPAVLAGVVYANPWTFLIALAIIGTLCLHEYFSLTRAMGLGAQPAFGYAAFWVLMIGLHGQWIPGEALLSGLLIAAFLAAMWRRVPLRDRAQGLMANLLGLVYPGLFLYAAVPVRFSFGEARGLQWLVILLFVVWAGDTVALFTGRNLGRSAFAPLISPKKTNEGALGGLMGGVGIAVLLQHFLFTQLPLGHVITLAILSGIFGQLGDLAESLLKRAAEVKDSSRLIPGHGGVLDRIDSLLFALPVTYLYLLFLYRH
jgi:phosphatidate cytidylyltransferase